MHYEIISTGSKGNCVIINDVMIDCGVPFKKIKEHLYDIRYLILTHIHSDHIKEATLNNIKKLFPKITIIGNYEVHQVYGVDSLANAGYKLDFGDYSFKPFECEHDVLTYGYAWEYDKEGTMYPISIIYATDTSSMRNAPKGKYDYLFIESNHCEKKIEQIKMSNSKFGYNAYGGAKRHLSTQAAKSFYYSNRRSRDSVFIELHQSNRFY